MKKIILILISILFISNVYAHSTKGVTPNFDYKQNCTKKNSVLNYISKHKLYSGDKGEIIKFNSYTAFDVQNVMSGALLKKVLTQIALKPISRSSVAIIVKAKDIAPDVIITFE